ncbi:MAG: hypothetical protein HUU22_02135 [Phycisphaerae bacterium]|nr:hypothetical protein [Phycisphaerae bacterium]
MISARREHHHVPAAYRLCDVAKCLVLSLTVLLAATAALLLTMPGPIPPDAAAPVVLSIVVVAAIAAAHRYVIISTIGATTSIVLSIAAAMQSAPIIPMMSHVAMPHLFLMLTAALNIAVAAVLVRRRHHYQLAALGFGIGGGLFVLLFSCLLP